jgi:ubiquinone/menaquinone biosynthesis C-methylase UbiE
MPYVLMKLFEEAPRKFDRWMRILTLGRLPDIRNEIARSAVSSGVQVLEIGCGTGTMAALLADHGANVVAIDTSAEMLREAREKIERTGIKGSVQLKNVSALEIEDQFPEDAFDRVVGILVLSELSDDEIDYVLDECRRVLRPSGKLFVVDEVEPRAFLYRCFFRGLRYPLRLITFLVLQAKDLKSSSLWKKVLYYVIEFPLMLLTFLVVPASTHPIAELDERVKDAGFRLVSSIDYLGGTLRLLQAERVA